MDSISVVKILDPLGFMGVMIKVLPLFYINTMYVGMLEKNGKT